MQGFMKMKKLFCKKGFTLLELLVATTVFALVMSGMYAAYSSMQRTTINQNNLVDVQQNLRVSMDLISRDIKMAAALIPAGTAGVSTNSDATTLNLATASSFYAYARISSDIEIPAGGGNDYPFNVSVPTAVDYFAAGNSIRIIRPQSGVQPYDAPDSDELTVDSVDRNGRIITIDNFGNTDTTQYNAGDIIVRVGNSAPDPSTIVWTLNGTDLSRNRDNMGAEVMANDVSDLTFSYLLNNGTETTAPTDDDLPFIRAIRVTITTDATQQIGGQDRQRSLSSTTYIRN